MRNKKGQFKKGVRPSPATEFKKGQHWRTKKPYWDRDWLYREYITERKSAAQIASEQGCKENNILYFLKKHQISTRTIKEIRAAKHWGSPGEENGMYGIRGDCHPNWKGGTTPERQALYNSLEWARVVQQVWARDGGMCQRCKRKRESYLDSFHIHHIVSFSENIDLRVELSNLILFCADCHHWVHSNENTEQKFIKEAGDLE